MNLKLMADAQLLRSTQAVVEIERKITADAIKHFFEIERRKLYLSEGYDSLYSMLTQRYLYCPATAMLRRNAVKLMTDVPDVIAKIESGAMPVTVVANIQSFLNAEAKQQKPYSQQAKIELVQTCLGKSVIEVQKEFVRRNPALEKRESVRLVTEDRLRVSHSISTELEEKLKRIKLLWSHVDPNMSRENLLDRMAEITLDQIDPVRKADRANKRKEKASVREVQVLEIERPNDSLRVPEVKNVDVQPADRERRSRYITAEDDRQIRAKNAEAGCEFVVEATGQTCGSHFQLQRDHINPYAHGGANEADNLRMYCANHNRWRWQNRKNSTVRSPQLKYG